MACAELGRRAERARRGASRPALAGARGGGRHHGQNARGSERGRADVLVAHCGPSRRKRWEARYTEPRARDPSAARARTSRSVGRGRVARCLDVGARDVEAVAVLELSGSRLAAARISTSCWPRRKPLAAELAVFGDHPRGELHGPVVAEELVNRPGDPLGLAAQQRELVGVREQRQHRVSDELRRRLVPGDEEQHAGREELGPREAVAGLLRRTSPRAGPRADQRRALTRRSLEVRAELVWRPTARRRSASCVAEGTHTSSDQWRTVAVEDVREISRSRHGSGAASRDSPSCGGPRGGRLVLGDVILDGRGLRSTARG